MAKSVNKIRARDMDEQLMLALQTGASSGDVSDFLANYVSKTDTIALSQINNAELKDFLNDQHYLSGQIKLTDLSTEVINYIANSAGTNYDPGISTTDVTTLQELIEELQETVGTQAKTIEGLEGRIKTLEEKTIDVNDIDLSGYVKKSDYESDKETIEQNITRLGDNITTIEGDITTISTTVNNYSDTTITTSQLDQSIQEQLSKIPTLEMTIENLPSHYLPIPSTGSKGLVYYNSTTKKTYCRSAMIPCYIYTTSSDITAAKSSKLSPIVDVSASTIWYYNNSNQSYTSESFKGDSGLYEGCSLVNLQTEAIEYIITDGSLFQVKSAGGSGTGGSNSTSITLFKYTLQKGQSTTIDRANNLNKMPPLVLVKDTETGSRTKGKYLNAEGVLTLANDNAGITIYNDSGSIADIIVSVPQMDTVNTDNIRTGTSAPTDATDGTIWFDLDNALIKFWDEINQHWIIFSAAIE